MTTSTKPVLSAVSTVADILRDYDKLDAGIVEDHCLNALICPPSDLEPLASKLPLATFLKVVTAVNQRITAQAVAAVPKSKTTAGNIHVKTSRSGAVSVYGLQRMPVTLYAGQWERFADEVLPKVLAHIAEDKPHDHEAYGKPGEKDYRPSVKGVRIVRK